MLRAAGHPATTVGLRTYHLRRLAGWAGARDPWGLTLDDLLRWTGSYEWKVETRRSYRSSLRGFWRWGVMTDRTMVDVAIGLPSIHPAQPKPRTPIAYALGWPKRISAPADRLDFAKIRELTFESPDPVRFPALRLARSVLQAGGQAPTILNAANEIGVAAFLDRKIAFTDIAVIVESVLEEMGNRALGSLADVLETDLSARQVAQRQVAARLRNNEGPKTSVKPRKLLCFSVPSP